MKILIIGSGGREHAIAWALARSPHVDTLYIAPGNAGTANVAPFAQNIAITADDHEGLLEFALERNIDLTVVGPEGPLAVGIVDEFQAEELRIFGPTKAAAQIEASKAFAKRLMEETGIPTAAYGTFDNYDAAREAIDSADRPLVIKADGLAGGKGVAVCEDTEQAQEALKQIMFSREFSDSGSTVIIEERLTGREVSLLAFSDGKTVVPMPPARDHKRANDHDEGPNTGGMGAIAPVPDLSEDDVRTLYEMILQPAIAGMAARGTPFTGVLYAGLMLTPDGPKVLEFNCRFGDPETQALLPLLETDLLEILWTCTEGRLHEVDVRWNRGACATVVLASLGYPGAYLKGLPISGLTIAETHEDVMVFHSGTALKAPLITTAGGRVLSVSAVDETLHAAIARAYAAVGQIHFDGMHYRRDIGKTRP